MHNPYNSEGTDAAALQRAADAAYPAAVSAMAQAVADAGLPGQVSYSAGAFVCNDVLYTLLHHFALTQTKVGFIHVPFLPEQGSPSMPLEQITRALEWTITACEMEE